MEGKIRILDELVANKIAAGEVVERPSAVVKELVENALDAGAAKIEIEIEESGSKLIKVTDNGSGMVKSDAILALERHATSKIREADDLFKITTLGFRGEALPSIAAVSTLEISTRVTEQLAGSYLKVVGGEVKEVREVGCPVGTSIAVRQLFFNTPARLKYLKSPSTEMGHILEMVNHLSLAHPQIAFRLTHNGRQVFLSAGKTDLLEVILNIYGKETARAMLPVNFGSSRISLQGFVGQPNVARGSRNCLNFFVNGRFIRSRVMARAVEDAYKTLLPLRKYPVAVLSFQIAPTEIDVNVHPTKTEIRFSDEREIYLLTYQSVSQALKGGGSQLIPQMEKKPATVKEEEKPSTLEIALAEETKSLGGRIKESNNFYQSTLSPEIEETYLQKSPEQVLTESTVKLPAMEPLGQIHNTFIVAEGPDGMLIIDQHAAHERILYEKLQTAKNQGEVTSQTLLIPVELDLTPQEKAIWEELAPILAEIGFAIEYFGGNTYLVRAIPTFMENKDILPLIRQIIDDFLSSPQKKKPAEWQEKALVTMSCRLAVKAGDHLDTQEIRQLLKSLEATANPYTCPHGRPTLLNFSFRELEANFKRR